MSLVRQFAQWCVRQDGLWRILDKSVLRMARYLEWARTEVDRTTGFAALTARFLPPTGTPLVVLGGPFAGMRYPGSRAVGSALTPKILGTYESELHACIEDACAKSYDRVVDVGCAEGYYAVGLARRLPSATVYAFDTDAEARELCRDMAQVNAVAHRVVIGAACDAPLLAELATQGPMLVISDCEGYEDELLSPKIVPALARHDLLVECHDFLRPGVTTALIIRFSATHHIQALTSTPDGERPIPPDAPALARFTPTERRRLLAEHRPGQMTWLYMTPKIEQRASQDRSDVAVA